VTTQQQATYSVCLSIGLPPATSTKISSLVTWLHTYCQVQHRHHHHQQQWTVLPFDSRLFADSRSCIIEIAKDPLAIKFNSSSYNLHFYNHNRCFITPYKLREHITQLERCLFWTFADTPYDEVQRKVLILRLSSAADRHSFHSVGRPSRYEVGGLVGGKVSWTMCTQPWRCVSCGRTLNASTLTHDSDRPIG